MRVSWVGTFDPSFGRNRQLARFLDGADIDFDVVRVELWPSDRVWAFQNARGRILVRMLVVYPLLFVKLLMSPRPDIYLVSYPGWFDVPVVKVAAALRRRPVAFDVFISLFDTAVSDRQLVPNNSVIGRVARLADRISIRLSDLVIADCPAHARFLSQLAGVGEDHFGIVFLGADESIFKERPDIEAQKDTVLFYGTFVPLQGVESIVGAAALLKDRGIKFRLVGDGQVKAAAARMARELGADNVEFVGLLPQNQIVEEIARSSVCLGVFGVSGKANRVIPHKVFEALACGRAVLTASTEAITDVFTEGEIATCPPDDAEAIAEHIADMLSDDEYRQRIGHAGRVRFERDFSAVAVAARLADQLHNASDRAG